jgi:tripartite ATP-independent transporter DctP family solute receptor
MIKPKLKAALRTTAIALIGSAGLSMATPAAAKITLRIGWTTTDSAVDPYAIMARFFAEELDKAAPGRFRVKFFPNHQFGNDTEMLQAMRFGTLDAGVITSTPVSTIVPAFQINDLPFLYRDSAHAHKVLDGEVGQALFEQLAKKKIVGLGFAEAGFRHVINNVRPIQTPDDMARLRLRVQPSELFLAAFRSIGANPVPMPWSDVFTAVQQGTVDGLEIPLAVIYANKYPGVTKYLSLTRHSYSALAVLISERTFKRLSKEDQTAVRQAATKAIEHQRKAVAANEAEILEKIKAAGMEINSIESTDAFRDKVAPVYTNYRDAIGADLLDKALNTK